MKERNVLCMKRKKKKIKKNKTENLLVTLTQIGFVKRDMPFLIQLQRLRQMEILKRENKNFFLLILPWSLTLSSKNLLNV